MTCPSESITCCFAMCMPPSRRERIVVAGPRDDAARAVFVHRRVVVPEFAEDLASVLPLHGCRANLSSRCVAERDEVAELAHASEPRVLVLCDEPEAEEVVVEED